MQTLWSTIYYVSLAGGGTWLVLGLLEIASRVVRRHRSRGRLPAPQSRAVVGHSRHYRITPTPRSIQQ